MTVYCSKCSYPLPPDGRCPRCTHQDEAHSGTWTQFWTDEKRYLDRQNTKELASIWLIILSPIIVIILLSLWAS